MNAKCKACGAEKPLEEFYRYVSGTPYTHCKPCHRARCVGNERARPEVRQRSQYRKFGITPADYDALFIAQGGLCAICGLPESGRRLAVDHNHETGVVRGLLCFRCNSTLGWLERAEWRSLADDYLKAPPAPRVLRYRDDDSMTAR